MFTSGFHGSQTFLGQQNIEKVGDTGSMMSDRGWGQVLVNGLRVRVRLDEARLTELLRNATDAATSAGLLACLGDLATVSFDPHLSGVPTHPFTCPSSHL